MTNAANKHTQGPRERDENGAPYVPAHPVQIEVVVTLSNGKTATVSIDEDGYEERGDLYGALLPAGVLLGRLGRTGHKELRAARERAEAYGR